MVLDGMSKKTSLFVSGLGIHSFLLIIAHHSSCTGETGNSVLVKYIIFLQNC